MRNHRRPRRVASYVHGATDSLAWASLAACNHARRWWRSWAAIGALTDAAHILAGRAGTTITAA
jgi:carbamate kinase